MISRNAMIILTIFNYFKVEYYNVAFDAIRLIINPHVINAHQHALKDHFDGFDIL